MLIVLTLDTIHTNTCESIVERGPGDAMCDGSERAHVRRAVMKGKKRKKERKFCSKLTLLSLIIRVSASESEDKNNGSEKMVAR